MERVSSFKYLGVNISEDLTWTTHIQTQVKKARQRLYHLRQLRKFRVSPAILKTFYSGVLRPCVLLARLLVAVFFQESVGDRTPLLPVHHLIMERIKQWTQTLIFTSSRGSTASGGVTSFANLYLSTAHTNLFCSPFGF